MALWYSLVCTLSLLITAGSAQKYSNRYETVDIDSILSNKRILDNYINCFVDKGPCTAEARDFKQDIPLGILHSCADCTDIQRKVVKKAGKFMLENRPGDLDAILERFDPKNEHRVEFKKYVLED